MTNGDYMRNKLADEYIAEYIFCDFFIDCDGCPFDKENEEPCMSYKAKLDWLREQRNE